MQENAEKNIVVVALYKFVPLPDYKDLQKKILAVCTDNAIKGTLLLAEEGINGTISGYRDGIDNVIQYLCNDPRLADLQYKESYTNTAPFLRMKVRLKKEIVTIGLPEINPNLKSGTYVEPKNWNQLISDPDVLVIDTRNQYECAIGNFKNAINPETENFREFPDYVKEKLDPKSHKKVAMYCTGGIRCEKASAYMLESGFEEVYHLQGGILKYLEEIPPEDSLWEGECFVFDDRVAVGHDLSKGSYDQCHACRHPISTQDQLSEYYKPGISCPHCYGKRSPEQVASATERQKQIELAKQRNTQHLGAEIQRQKKQTKL